MSGIVHFLLKICHIDITNFCGTICGALNEPINADVRRRCRRTTGGIPVEEKTSKLRELFYKYHEIIMYLVFGVITTLVSWVAYSICEKSLSMISGLSTDVVMLVSGVISWLIAVTVAFITNKLWVFESKSWEHKLVWTEAITFYGGRALTGIIEVIAVPALVKLGFDAILFGVDGLPAKILVSILIMILNYILSKFISFKDTGSNKNTKRENPQ